MIAKSLLERGTQTNRQGLTNRMINADGDGDCVLIVCDDQMLDFSSAGECDVLNDSEISRHVLKALAEYGDVATESLGGVLDGRYAPRESRNVPRTIDSILAESRLGGARKVSDVLNSAVDGVGACSQVIIVLFRPEAAVVGRDFQRGLSGSPASSVTTGLTRTSANERPERYGAPVQRESEAELFPSLTPREREVLQLILDGCPNKNIAADLQISMRTVENHRASIMKKTGCKSLAALVRFAITGGELHGAPSHVRQ